MIEACERRGEEGVASKPRKGRQGRRAVGEGGASLQECIEAEVGVAEDGSDDGDEEGAGRVGLGHAHGRGVRRGARPHASLVLGYLELLRSCEHVSHRRHLPRREGGARGCRGVRGGARGCEVVRGGARGCEGARGRWVEGVEGGMCMRLRVA